MTLKKGESLRLIKLKYIIKMLIYSPKKNQGAGESGKSTIAKQMKIIYLSGFTEEELLTYKPVLQSNALEAMRLLVNACANYEYTLEEEHKKLAEKFLNINTIETTLTPELRDDIKELWKDSSIKKAHKRRAEFQLHDSAE